MNLDNVKEIEKQDIGQVAKSIELLADQVREVLEEVRLIKIPKEYSQVNQVVVAGMGGSNLGAGIVKSVFSSELKVPINIIAGYDVLEYVNKNTLFILSSYSGGTEEPLSTYKEAKKRGAKILGITSGGKLEKLMLKDDIPGLIFKPQNNPSNQPRLGLGYSIFGMSVLMAKSGLFTIKTKDVKEVIDFLELHDRLFRPNIITTRNLAKKIALKLYGKQPIIIGSEFMQGNLRILRNQFCETSKNFASYLILPDLNHYAMEGLTHPVSNKDNLIFLFFDSTLYHKRVQKRSELTKQIIKKNKIEVITYNLKGITKLEQSFEMLQLGTWITYYLGMLNNVHPSEIPFVDWFKKQLK